MAMARVRVRAVEERRSKNSIQRLANLTWQPLKLVRRSYGIILSTSVPVSPTTPNRQPPSPYQLSEIYIYETSIFMGGTLIYTNMTSRSSPAPKCHA